MSFIRNQALVGFPFGLVHKNTGQAITSGTVNGWVTLDGGNQTAIAASPVHEGNGQWTVDLTAAEMNGALVGLLFIHADAVPLSFTLRTIANTSDEDDDDSDSGDGGSSGSGLVDVLTAVNTPKRVRTEEGTVEERSIQELIDADRYLSQRSASDAVPWGLRVARVRPGGPGGV